MDVVECAVTPLGGDEFGQVIDGHITLDGELQKLHPKDDDEPTDVRVVGNYTTTDRLGIQQESTSIFWLPNIPIKTRRPDIGIWV